MDAATEKRKRKLTTVPLGKRPHTIGLAPDLHQSLVTEASSLDMPWTTLVSVLLREALAARKRDRTYSGM